MGLYRVLLLGASSVGKTCLFNRYFEGPAGFSPDTLPTTEGRTWLRPAYLDHDRAVHLVIRDTSGIGGFGYTVDEFRTNAVIIVYDITQQGSLEIARAYLDECRIKSRPNIFKALAGNKADLVSDRKVTFEDGQSHADDNDVDLFMEVSALTGENVEKLFVTVVNQLEIERTLKQTIRIKSKALNLEGKRLLRISDAITELLTEVEILNLSHNELAKLPRSTRNLSNLTKLNLNHNKLTQFPEVVVTLINLTHLFLNDNELSTLPANMKNLEKLEELELRNNNIEKIYEDIVELHHLKKLSVAGNPLGFEEIESLMTQGMSLDIAG